MDIRVSGHQIDTGAALQEHVDDRLNSIVEKYFSRAISSSISAFSFSIAAIIRDFWISSSTSMSAMARANDCGGRGGATR